MLGMMTIIIKINQHFSKSLCALITILRLTQKKLRVKEHFLLKGQEKFVA